MKAGEWDYVHSGFPCGSFSMARHNPVPGQLAPVRDKMDIYERRIGAHEWQLKLLNSMKTKSIRVFTEEFLLCQRWSIRPQ